MEWVLLGDFVFRRPPYGLRRREDRSLVFNHFPDCTRGWLPVFAPKTIATILCGGLFLLGGCAGKATNFGEPLTLSAFSTVSVGRVLAQPEKYEGKRIRVSGVVDSVCAARGCWLRLADEPGGETLFVKFNCPIEGRLIPMEATGHKAYIEGILEISRHSEAQRRHLAEDAGQSPDQIAKIVGPEKVLKLNAPAARIVGLEQEEKEP